MSRKQTIAAWTVLFGSITAACVGIGSNAWLGLATFFGLWCLSGILETMEANDE